jgi:hypothetical protein
MHHPAAIVFWLIVMAFLVAVMLTKRPHKIWITPPAATGRLGRCWRSFQEPFFDSCGMMRDVVISIMATLAEQERITISERTKAGLARTRKAGTRLGRRPAQIDMTLVEKRHADGESLRGIARSSRVSPALLIKRRKAAAAS